MGHSGADAPPPREGSGAVADRKQAERERLAAALRANLNRRKEQSRARWVLDAGPAREKPRGEGGEDPAETL
jgi:regulator of protease activity HflC (stomatin/prohibitin superfamily)